MPRLPASVPDGWTVRWEDRWAVLAMFNKLFVGRGVELEAVVHLCGTSDQIRAYPPGLVIHLFGKDHAFSWDSFDQAEIKATPLAIELAPSLRRRVRVLLAGATILRVEILEPEPNWQRTATVASHGNPLGFAVGDEALAVGNEIKGEFAIAHLGREELGTSPTSARGDPVTVARSKVQRPAWVAGLARAGLIDSPDDAPEYTWTGTPLEALASIYEPRDALDRGFVWYTLKIGNCTKSLVADFERMAQAPKGALKGIRMKFDEDFDGFQDVLEKVNTRLAALGLERRIYEVVHKGTWYALIARAPTELAEVEEAGLNVGSGTA
jgi:hypothetical protein